MKKRMLSLLLIGAMTASMLVGCSAKKEGSVPGTETATVEGVADNLDESQDISIWLYKDDYKIYDSYNENPVVQYLNDKFNCTLDFQQPAMGSEQEQFSLMIGTGSYTDIMEITYSQESVMSLYDDGIIQDLAPYLEKYMPNFYAFLNADENKDVKKALYDEGGHLFTIPFQLRTDGTESWGGLVYREDILKTMTGGNVVFPSGNDVPTTIEDWEYMLPLYQQYFAAANLQDSACLILPAEGFFSTGELLTGFGVGSNFYVEDGKVKFGPTQQGFYNYLKKMNEWYDAGYIYKDFASRTTDVFYLPNTALTYAGAAGIWFGLNAQLDDAMSMPEYGLEVNVQPATSPLDTATTSKLLAYTGLDNERATMDTQGYVVSSSCSKEKMIRFMTVTDYLFSEEGAMLRSYGLTADQGAAENEYYKKAGLENGAYTLDGDKFTYAEPLQPNVGAISKDSTTIAYVGQRLPGLMISKYEVENTSESGLRASHMWKGTGKDNNYSNAIIFSAEDSSTKSNNYTNYNDYLVTMAPKFIVGTEKLNEETFKAFVDQMNTLGVEENLKLYQQYYDSYMSK